MTTKIFNIPGKAYWASLNVPKDEFGTPRYTMNLAPTQVGWGEFEKSGLQLQRRDPADNPEKYSKGAGGEVYVTLRRDAEKTIKGDLVHFPAPMIYDEKGELLRRVIDANGQTVYSYKEGDHVETEGRAPGIGNGSDVIVRIAVYQTERGAGHRLEAIRIMNLVPMPDGPGAPEAPMTPNQEVEAQAEPSVKDAKPAAETKEDGDLPW